MAKLQGCSFNRQFSFHYYLYCYNQKQLSSGVLQKRRFYKFHKIHEKTPALKTRFWRSSNSTEFCYIKKEIPAQIFSCEFNEISHNTSFKGPSYGCFCINAHSIYFPTTTIYFFKNDVTYFAAGYFLDLIFRLGTRVSSIFQTLSQTPIFNQAEHLRGSLLFEIVNSLKPLSIFAKQLTRRYWVRF